MTLPNSIQKDRGEPAKVRIGRFADGQFTLQETILQDVGVLSAGGPVNGDSVALIGQSAVGTSGTSWLALGHPVAPGGASFRGARLTVGVTAVPNVTVTPIPWSAEDYDTDGFWDFSNPSVVTIPFDGVYAFTFYLSFAAVAAGGLRYVQITRSTVRMAAHRHAAVAGDFNELGLATEFSCVAGDLIRFDAFQNTGASLNTLEGSATVRLVGTLSS